MPKITLIPSELRNLKGVPDIGGQFIEVLAADPLVTTINHRLDKRPNGFIVIWKSGYGDIFLSAETKTQITINRNAAVDMSFIIY